MGFAWARPGRQPPAARPPSIPALHPQLLMLPPARGCPPFSGAAAEGTPPTPRPPPRPPGGEPAPSIRARRPRLPPPSSLPGGPRLRRHVVGLTPPREAEEEAAAAPPEQALTGSATGTKRRVGLRLLRARRSGVRVPTGLDPRGWAGEREVRGRRGASSGGAGAVSAGPRCRPGGGGARPASALPCGEAPAPAAL